MKNVCSRTSALLFCFTSGLISLAANQGASAAGPTQQATVDLNKLTVTLDTKGYAKSVQREILPPEPSLPIDEIIMLNGLPECLRLRFDNQKVTYNNGYNEKHLLVFPLKQYAALYQDQERKRVFKQNLDVIKKIIATGSDRGVDDIPIFPQNDAAQTFHNQLRCFKFKNGAGFSFIGRDGNGDPPLRNDGQFYCFEGLTDDGRFLVMFATPITSVGMPPDLPIPKGVAYLAKLPRNKFTPDLDSLDRMMKTLQVK